MLVDEVQITIKGGHGGPGKVSFYPGLKAGPDGGNGGRGGDVYAGVTSDLTALNRYSQKKYFSAEEGGAGESNRKSGKNGGDLELTFPVGTSFMDSRSGEEFELSREGERILVCKGGLGGRGNFEFKSSRRTTPEYAQSGLEGEIREFRVVLKLIADFGLIGLPNAGKSSLLNELTAAKARVADYPFTTLEPNLGVLDGKIIADIPGLIEGASGGKGLGIKFLKHIEKVGLLLHCVSTYSNDVRRDYKVVRKELGEFSPALLEKKEIILLTKSDLVENKELEKKFKILKKLNPSIQVISIHDFDSIESLKKTLK